MQRIEDRELSTETLKRTNKPKEHEENEQKTTEETEKKDGKTRPSKFSVSAVAFCY